MGFALLERYTGLGLALMTDSVSCIDSKFWIGDGRILTAHMIRIPDYG